MLRPHTVYKPGSKLHGPCRTCNHHKTQRQEETQHDEEQEYNGGPDEGGSVDEYKGVRVITLSFTIGNLAKLLYIQYAISDSFFQTMKMEDKYSHGVQVPQSMVLMRRLVSMIYLPSIVLSLP